MTDEPCERDESEHPMGVWLRERLTGPKGRQDWERVVESSWDQILETTLRELVPPDRMRALLRAHLDPDRLAEFVRPVMQKVVPHVVGKHRQDTSPIGRWVPDSATGSIERMASRKGLVHEDWIRALFRQRVVEAVMADALYRGIRDFSTIMPRMMMSVMPTQRLGRLGGASTLGKRLVEEVEKRIEPEIKAFLKGGTKRALARAADFAVEHRDDEKALAFRRNVVRFVLSKSPSFHTHPFKPELLEDLAPIADKVARHMATREETLQLIDEALMDVDCAWGEKPVGQTLEELGIKHRPDLKAWADATWPGLVVCLTAPEARKWMDGLVTELLEEHAKRQ